MYVVINAFVAGWEPASERSSDFSQQLMRTKRPQTAFLIAISYGLTNWIGVLLALLPIVMLWNDRRGITEASGRAPLRPRQFQNEHRSGARRALRCKFA